jgi:hypothetical protein
MCQLTFSLRQPIKSDPFSADRLAKATGATYLFTFVAAAKVTVSLILLAHIFRNFVDYNYINLN